MAQTTETLKPVMALVENYHSSKRPTLLVNESKSANGENLLNVSESSNEVLGDKVMSKIWARMASIYGHKWSSHLGVVSDAEGRLTDAAKMWQKGLVGVSLDSLKAGFDALVLDAHAWPPSLPEFRKLCLARTGSDVPSLDQAMSILVMVASRSGSLAVRYRHPLVLAIAGQVDMFTIRTAKAVDARRLVKPVYEALLQSGWDDWPAHAHDEQKALAVEVKRNRCVGLAALGGIRAAL